MILPTPELIAKYAGRGPRYTSYPPVPVWTDEIGPDAYRAALAQAGARSGSLELYVHLPFCAERCWYCGCNVVIEQRFSPIEDYITHLLTQARTVAELLGAGRQVTALHIGGGTPNQLTHGQLARLVGGLEQAFHFSPHAERSIEIDPRLVRHREMADVVGLGFRRLSFGVQDLDPDVGHAIGRQMDSGHIGAIVAESRHAGATGINIDLMYGLPRQTPDSMAATVDVIGSAVRPDRIAVYGYAHVPWLRPKQRKLEKAGLPGPDARVQLFAAALVGLQRAGYGAVGLDHFALPSDPLMAARNAGTLRRSFMGYTDIDAPDLVGLGASAIGFLQSAARPTYVQNAVAVKAYHRAADGLAVARGCVLTEEDVARSEAIMDVLCRLRARTIPEDTGALREFETDGLIEMRADGFEVTDLGRYFLRPIAMLFDEYAGMTSGDKPRYSAAL